MTVTLESYITDARAKNKPNDVIKTALINAGWPENEVMKALEVSPIDPDLPPPPPPPQLAHIGMWTGFLYILFFISLYVLASSIAGLLHNMVDKFLPDIKEVYEVYTDVYPNSFNRGAIAAIIVSYPIFITLAFMLKKQINKQSTVKNLRSRKQLIYITLVVTFLIMLGHIIFSIYSFLDGKLTANALAHLGVTFIVAGSIFGFFVSEVIHDRKS